MKKQELRSGSTYEAVLALGPFESMVSNEIVASKLRKAGFIQVVVTGSGKSRRATGVWGGVSQTVELPSQVASIKLVGA